MLEKTVGAIKMANPEIMQHWAQDTVLRQAKQ